MASAMLLHDPAAARRAHGVALFWRSGRKARNRLGQGSSTPITSLFTGIGSPDHIGDIARHVAGDRKSGSEVVEQLVGTNSVLEQRRRKKDHKADVSLAKKVRDRALGDRIAKLDIAQLAASGLSNQPRLARTVSDEHHPDFRLALKGLSRVEYCL
jgi:hypothetical protein